MKYNALNVLTKRLDKIGIEIQIVGNIPWIYLHKVNGNAVKDKFHSDYGFTIAYSPVRVGDDFTLTDISEIFKVIRKYK